MLNNERYNANSYIELPLKYINRNAVSFTYGPSYYTFVRDDHPILLVNQLT